MGTKENPEMDGRKLSRCFFSLPGCAAQFLQQDPGRLDCLSGRDGIPIGGKRNEYHNSSWVGPDTRRLENSKGTIRKEKQQGYGFLSGHDRMDWKKPAML